MSRFRTLFGQLLAAVIFGLGVSDAAQQLSEDRELKELDLNLWNCLTKAEGTARNPEGNDRNRLKNRAPIELAGAQVTAFDTAGFLKHVGVFDPQLSGKRRKDLSPDVRKKLEPPEKELVSLTGYIVLAYPGPPETTNCGSTDFHDWHLEVCEKPSDHPPQPGDPTPIICEITPRTQTAIYHDGIRVQELAAFFRRSDLTYESTGHKAIKVRVTGFLMWDDEHNDTKDVGATIQTIGRSKYHNPWRSTAWEIHPVLKIEKLDGTALPLSKPAPSAPSSPSATPAEEGSPPESTPAGISPTPAATAVPTATPQRYVTILRQVKIKIPYGETILPRGMRLRVISQTATTVTVEYLGQKQAIPITSTDFRESAPNRIPPSPPPD